jgi:hypothetical protein
MYALQVLLYGGEMELAVSCQARQQLLLSEH